MMPYVQTSSHPIRSLIRFSIALTVATVASGLTLEYFLDGLVSESKGTPALDVT